MPFEQFAIVPKRKLTHHAVLSPTSLHLNNREDNEIPTTPVLSNRRICDTNHMGKAYPLSQVGRLRPCKKINFSNLNLRIDGAPSPLNYIPPHSEVKKRRINEEHGTDGGDSLKPSSEYGSSSPSSSHDNTSSCSWYIDTKASKTEVNRSTIENMVNKTSQVGNTNNENQKPPKNNIKMSTRQNNLKKKSGILDIVVKKGSIYVDNTCKVPTYLTNSEESRGNVLILNNINFVIPSKNRPGAVIDCTNIITLFKEMGFLIQHHQNKTAKGMKNTIETYCKSLKARDIQIIVIMSHGDEEYNKLVVQGTDMKLVQVEWIINQFAKCPYLAGKPKFFIFQCCRGPRKDDQTDSGSNPIHSVPRRAASDILLAYPATPGYVAYISNTTGSRYIQTICKVFMEHAHDTHVEDLLKIVDNQINHNRREFQTCSYENWGFKKCYLNPIKSNPKI